MKKYVSSYNHKGFLREAFVAFGIKENLKNLGNIENLRNRR